jgi:hypothetical protein
MTIRSIAYCPPAHSTATHRCTRDGHGAMPRAFSVSSLLSSRSVLCRCNVLLCSERIARIATFAKRHVAILGGWHTHLVVFWCVVCWSCGWKCTSYGRCVRAQQQSATEEEKGDSRHSQLRRQCTGPSVASFHRAMRAHARWQRGGEHQRTAHTHRAWCKTSRCAQRIVSRPLQRHTVSAGAR